ncbi:MAG: MOSC domain-containing protein [Nitrospira sp.]
MTNPHLHQISVSTGGVPKRAVPRARVTKHGVEGDRQRNLEVHGGPDRAICLYALELIEALRKEGHSIVPGSAGENFTIAGLVWKHVEPGTKLRVGDEVRVEVLSYTAPCKHNACWFKDGDFSRIAQKSHPGWSRVYAKVLAEGTVKQGDPVVVEA